MRELLILGLLLSGCASQPDWYGMAYKQSFDACIRLTTYNKLTTLTPAEYAETEQYRSKVDPELDDKAAIQAVYDRKRQAMFNKCDTEAKMLANNQRYGPPVSLPVTFVAPLY